MSGFRPEDIFAALQRRAVDYVAIGGFAVIAHGHVRATEDVDLLVDPGPANLARLAGALADLEAVPDGEPDTPVTPDLLARDANMRFQTAAGQVDILLAEQYRRRYPDIAARALRVEVGDIAVVVPAKADLIVLKAATGRPRDLLDIGELLALDEED